MGENEEFRRFQEEEAWWLKDYALFMAVKQRFEGKPWSEWAEDIRLRWQNALDYYRRELYFEIEFQEYMQFKFRQQWMKLKAYANKQGIRDHWRYSHLCCHGQCRYLGKPVAV